MTALALPLRVARRVVRTVLPQQQNRAMTANLGPFAMVYRPNTADESVLFKESFTNDQYFKRAFPDLELTRADTVVDIGAHLGGFAILAAQTAGRVFAIEAMRSTYNVLAANKHLNGCDNLTVSHLAIADSRGEVTLYDSPDGNWGASLTEHGSLKSERVPSMSLADYFHMYGIGNVALLKCNAEGAEFPIFLSAPIELLRNIQRMVVMYHEDLGAPHTRGELAARFTAAGFQAKVIEQEGPGRGAIVAVR